MAEVRTAADTLRAAVAAGEDASSFFGGWTGLEHQVLVRAINSSPSAVASAAATKTMERSTGGDAATSDPYPQPPADPQTMSAVAGDAGVGVRLAKPAPKWAASAP